MIVKLKEVTEEIFYHNDEEKAIAKKVIGELNKRKVWDAPIVTQIECQRIGNRELVFQVGSKP